MYFHTDEPTMISWLANVLDQARVNRRSVRFDVTSEGALKVKIGEGMWTHPFPSTPDPHRDV